MSYFRRARATEKCSVSCSVSYYANKKVISKHRDWNINVDRRGDDWWTIYQLLMLFNTHSDPKCLAFDFFDTNFDHSSHLKYVKNIEKLKYILKIHYVINHIIFDFLFWIIKVAKADVKHLSMEGIHDNVFTKSISKRGSIWGSKLNYRDRYHFLLSNRDHIP
jgi:hypothetical protein